MSYIETQPNNLSPTKANESALLRFFTSPPVLCGLVAVVAGALWLQFSFSNPDYYADYDLYPFSVQVMTLLLVLVGWVAVLAAWGACFLGKCSSSESFFGGGLTVFFLFLQLLPSSNFPAFVKHRTDDLNKARQLALGMLNYESANKRFPSAGNGDGRNGLSWRVHILPFMGYEDLYQRFRLNESWDSPHNMALIGEMPDVFSSRSQAARLEVGKTVFLCPVGNGSAFPADGTPVGFEDIHDGSSNTILVVQADPAEAVVWTKPADYKLDPADPTRGLGGVLPGKIFIATTCDGSTHTIDSQSAVNVMAWMTRDGNEPLDEFGELVQ